MNFKVKRPCAHCPFRSDIRPYLRQQRAAEIAHSLRDCDQSFSCHETTHRDRSEESFCAGALILLEREGQPNRLPRIAAMNPNLYDPSRLDKKSVPVYTSFDDWIASQDN